MTDARTPDPTDPVGPLEPVDPGALGVALGEVAAAVDGVTRVQARPGLGALVHGALDGAVGGLRSIVGQRATSPVDRAAGPSGPVVGVVVSDVDVRVVLDLCVTEDATAPVVARRVAEALLAHPALAALPPASVDLRVVGVDS